MKKITTFILFGFMTAVFLSCSSTTESSTSSESMDSEGLEIPITHTYKQLKIIELDQMMEMMFEKSEEAKQTDDVQKLREGAQIAYSRPNEDRMIDKIISVVKNPLEDKDEWEATLRSIVHQNIFRMTDKSLKPVEQVTAGIILENVISDIKPDFLKQYETGGFETTIIEKIAKTDVAYSKEALQERRLNLMRSMMTPQEIAQKLIQIKEKALKNKKK